MMSISDISEMKSQVIEIKSKLSDTNYENFAKKNPKTKRPDQLEKSFLELLEQLDSLVREALDQFPRSNVDLELKQGKDLLDVKRTSVRRNDFETGKETLLQVVRIIDENLIEEEIKKEEERNKTPISEPNPVQKTMVKNQSKIIFVSYHNEQILQQIKTVFNTIGEIAPEMGDLQTTDREQASNLDTVSQRIQDICSCYSAIICLPPDNSSDDSFNPLAYLDLGACLAFFPEGRTLLIHEGKKLPNNLVSTVETFHYQGHLDFESGMELARQILKVLRKDN